MSKDDLQRTISLTQSAFDKLVSILFEWAERKRLLREPFRFFDETSVEWEKLPEDWEGMARGVISLSTVLGVRENRLAFVRAILPEVAGTANELLKLWRNFPAYMTALRVKKHLGPNLLLAELVGVEPADWPSNISWPEIRLYSPRLAKLTYNENTLIMAMLWPGLSGVWHTYGPLFTLPTWSEADLSYLAACALVPRHSKRPPALYGYPAFDGSLLAIMTRHALVFQFLLCWSELPELRHGDITFHSITALASSEDSALWISRAWWEERLGPAGKRYIWEEAEDFISISLCDMQSWNNPAFMLCKSKRLLYVMAISDFGLKRAIEILPSGLQFDHINKNCFNLPTMASQIFGRPDLLEEAQDAVKEANPKDPQAEKQLEQVKLIGDRIVHCLNEGLPVNEETIAIEFAVSLEQVQNIAASLQEVLGRHQQLKVSANNSLPPRALHELVHRHLPMCEGYLKIASRTDLAAVAEEVPLLRLWNCLVDQAALHGGLIPATTSGYLQPAFVQHLFVTLHGFAYEFDDEGGLPPMREKGWQWLFKARKFFMEVSWLREDSKGFRLAGAAKAMVGDDGKVLESLLDYALYHHVWDPKRERSSSPSVIDYLNVLLYQLGVHDRKNPGSDFSMDDLLEWLMECIPQLDDYVAKTQSKLDAAQLNYPASELMMIALEAQLSDFFQYGCLAWFGFLEWQDDETFRVKPSFHRIFVTQ